jgi:hypothetical protein
MVAERDAVVALEHEQDGALDADLLGVGRREPVEGVLGVETERAEPAGEVRLAVLESSEVGGEAGEVASGASSTAWMSAASS